MACWSPENATKAYIRTLKMEKKETEPNAAEFISALAAGNNAQLMVAASAQSVPTANLLALVAAAQQTGGHIICIVPGREELQSSRRALKNDARFVEFIIGNASELLLRDYKEADFLLVDCNLENYERIMRGIQARRERTKGGVVVGYDAFRKGSTWQYGGLRTHLLPIGEGLLVTRIGESENNPRGEKKVKKSNWIVKVDKCTGEEHVFRVRSPQRKLEISA